MKLKFGLQVPEAIWFPDVFGDGFQEDELEVIENGGDTVFFYFEDYMNYTAIVNGEYIISGVRNGVKIGDWMVNLKVFGILGHIKAIACSFIKSVTIINEINSIGPDGLDVVKCRYSKDTLKRLA